MITEKRIDLDKPSLTSGDIVMIWPFNATNNVDKLPSEKLLFVQLMEKQQWHSIFKNVALLKNNDFVITTKITSEHIHGWYSVCLF